MEQVPTSKQKPTIKKIILAFFGPSLAIAITIFGYALVNFALSYSAPGSLVAFHTIVNIILFLFGAAAVISIPLGIIIGIIWLVERMSAK